MEPLEYLKVIQRRWYIPVLAVLLGVAAAVVTTPSEETRETSHRYTATHTLYRDPAARKEGYNLDTMALLGGTGVIPERVAERLDEDIDPARLAAEVSITADSGIGTLTVSSTQRDGERAKLLADAFAREIVAYFDEQQQTNRAETLERLSEQMASQEERIRELDAELRELPQGSEEGGTLIAERDALIRQYGLTTEQHEHVLSEALGGANLTTLQEAVPVAVVEEGFQPPRGRTSRAGIAAAIGLVLGVGLVILLDQLDTRVRTRRGAERAFGLPVVAEIPRLAGRSRRTPTIVTLTEPGSSAAEAFRILRLSLQIMPRWIVPRSSPVMEHTGRRPEPSAQAAGGSARVVLVTSASAREGKSSTVANLAASFAEVGRIVLVLDCDFRHPEQHRYFGDGDAGEHPGLADFLAASPRQRDLHRFALETAVPGVWLVPSGRPTDQPGSLIGPDQDLVDAATEIADVVIIDAGPILAVNEPTALVPHVDSVVVVARAGQTTAEAATRTSELLARLEAPVLGLVLVGVPSSAVNTYRYHQPPSAGGRPRRRTPDKASEVVSEPTERRA